MPLECFEKLVQDSALPTQLFGSLEAGEYILDEQDKEKPGSRPDQSMYRRSGETERSIGQDCRKGTDQSDRPSDPEQKIDKNGKNSEAKPHRIGGEQTEILDGTQRIGYRLRSFLGMLLFQCHRTG